MTLHWWMHWFWITSFAVVLPALLLTATPIRTAPAPTAEFLSYSSPLPSYEEDFDVIHPEAEVLGAAAVDEEVGEEPLDDISWPQETLPDATIAEEIIEPARDHHHVAPYGQLRNEEFTTYLPSPSPSTEEKQIRLADIYSVPTDGGRSVTEDIPAVSSDDEQEQDFLTGVPSNGEVESDSDGSEAEILPVPVVAQTTIITPENSSVRENNPEPSLSSQAELETSTMPSIVSEGPSVSIGDAVVNSRSQGMDKPLVNVPHSITRDLKNLSVAPADTPIWQSDTESVANAAEGGANGRLAKSALTFHSSLHESQYPQLSLDEEGHAAHSDRSAKAALVFHSPQIIAAVTTTTVQPVTTNEETADGLLRSKDSADVSILPSSAGQTGSGVLQQLQEQATGEVDHPSGVLFQPSEKPEFEGESELSKAKDGQGSVASSQKKLKVIPPLMSRTSANTSTSQTGRVLTDNGSNRGSGYTPPLITEPGVNVASIANVTDDPGIVAATTPAESSPAATGKKEPTVSPSIISDDVNMVPTVLNDENETSIEVTAIPSVIPVSKGRVAAAVPTGSHSGLDAASITGISLGILVFAALVGAVSFVLYRRRFLNKPQTLNDKCSNPDSSGYIDDSTLRENSEEMYSLDNDSFLNSLEAMTIQNYWTDNVKHTKL